MLKRILHISDSGMPDYRIIRSMGTGARHGYDVDFCGSESIPWNKMSKLHIEPFWSMAKNSLSAIISSYRPDIIHAHDLLAAKLASEFDIPYVYDAHEYWSKISSLRRTSSIGVIHNVKQYLYDRHAKNLWAEWERSIVSSVPTITINDAIADEFRYLSSSIYVVPNCPCIDELTSLNQVNDVYGHGIRYVYVGNDFKLGSMHRNMTGFLNVCPRYGDSLTTFGEFISYPTHGVVIPLPLLLHHDLLIELSRCHVGLIPWSPVTYHAYCLPDKACEYLHAGLLVIARNSLTQVKKMLGEYCMTFGDYQELNEIMSSLDRDHIESKRQERREFALSNLSWENFEHNILKAYDQVI